MGLLDNASDTTRPSRSSYHSLVQAAVACCVIYEEGSSNTLRIAFFHSFTCFRRICLPVMPSDIHTTHGHIDSEPKHHNQQGQLFLQIGDNESVQGYYHQPASGNVNIFHNTTLLPCVWDRTASCSIRYSIGLQYPQTLGTP